MSDLVKRLRDAAVMDPDYGPTVRMDIFDYGIVIAIADRIEELETLLRKAQEALGPFAKHGKLIDEQFADNDDDVIGAGFHEDPITLGDFRRANSTHAEIEEALK